MYTTISSWPLSQRPKAELLSRVEDLTARLAATNFSLSHLIACNRALDNFDSILGGDDSYGPCPTSPSTSSPFRIRRLKRSVTAQPSTIDTAATRSSNNGVQGFCLDTGDLSSESQASQTETASPLPAFTEGNIVEVVDRVTTLASQMKMRMEENRHIQALALQKAAVAASEAATLRWQVKELNNMSSQSASEIRYLASRMQALEAKSQNLTECITTETPSDARRAEAIEKWEDGVTAWWGDWAEVERRVEGRLRAESKAENEGDDETEEMTSIGSDGVHEMVEGVSEWVDLGHLPTQKLRDEDIDAESAS